jgi:cation diffusion facilitator CzcD-associated flavoprotein CzcO
MRDSGVDIVIVGAGVLGLYQLYLAQAAGYSVRLLEQGDGVGGTWYWNRYPGCRFDSESYTYGYLFSEELWQEWDWSEEFAAQPETEAYLNYVVDKFDLRRHIRLGARVTSAAWDAASGSWMTRTAGGFEIRSQFLISATGVLSVPQYPDVPGRTDFTGRSYHPGRWPREPVSFTGQRVAVVGTGSSGVQIAPAIAGDAASLAVYQRTPSWCTPLNNHPISPSQRAYLKASFRPIRDELNASIAGFLHKVRDRATFDDTAEERRAFYETIWNSPGFAKLGSNYKDLMTSPAANAEWCAFLEGKIRGIVADPATADKLVPTDHLYGGLRPPFVTGYYEMFNRPNVSLVSLRETPIVRVTTSGIQTTDQHREFDIIIWATGFDFGTGAMLRMGIAGAGGRTLSESWADGPSTFGGLMCHRFPNFFFPGGPHGAAGNNPRYGGEQVDFIHELISYAREHGYRRIEVPAEPQEAWMAMIEKYRARSSFQERGQYYGGNTAGKPRRFLLNPGGRPQLAQALADAIASDYKGFLQ